MIYRKVKTLMAPEVICRLLIVNFFLVCTLLSGGCSTVSYVGEKTKRMVKNIYRADSGLKRKVGMSVFENRTNVTAQEFNDNFLNYFSDRINAECSEVLFVKPDEDGYSNVLLKPPILASGRIDNLALVERARDHGLNAIMRGKLIEFSGEQERRGILWFKKNKNYIYVQVQAEIYDTETGAKLYDETFSQKVEVEVDVEEPDSETLQFQASSHKKEFNEALVQIAADMAETVCETVLHQPWRGFVTSVQESKITISSGSKVGLKPGKSLDVYENGATIEGAQGRQFFIPGGKIGEVKITAVSAETSEAEIVSGEQIKAGSTLRAKE